jgi:hypothetical protein
MKIKLACIVGLSLGVLLLCGGEPPAWLMKLEVLLFSMAALLYGYASIDVTSWFWSKPVRGMLCIYLGVGAMFIPPQFVVSAFFIGCGTRMVMGSFTTVVAHASKSFNTSLHRPGGDLVIREEGGITRR